MCQGYFYPVLWISTYILSNVVYRYILKKKWSQWYERARREHWGSSEDMFIAGFPPLVVSLASTFFINLFFCK
jgi:hypothetical protein